MSRTFRVLATVVAMGLVALLFSPAPSGAQPADRKVREPVLLTSVPVSGTLSDAAHTPISGTLTLTHLTNSAGVLLADGSFSYVANGVPVTQPFSGVPAAFDRGGPHGQHSQCQILNLVLGPIHLDLLGLVVDLNQVHLDVTAQSGPGNLLGNLLCAVGGLLDGTGLGGALTNLINHINAILSGLAL